MQIILKLFAVAFALVGIAYVVYQAATTVIGLPEIVILLVQLAFFLLGAGILLAVPALLRPR